VRLRLWRYGRGFIVRVGDGGVSVVVVWCLRREMVCEGRVWLAVISGCRFGTRTGRGVYLDRGVCLIETIRTSTERCPLSK
jgi:hypothetical protein